MSKDLEFRLARPFIQMMTSPMARVGLHFSLAIRNPAHLILSIKILNFSTIHRLIERNKTELD